MLKLNLLLRASSEVTSFRLFSPLKLLMVKRNHERVGPEGKERKEFSVNLIIQERSIGDKLMLELVKKTYQNRFLIEAKWESDMAKSGRVEVKLGFAWGCSVSWGDC